MLKTTVDSKLKFDKLYHGVPLSTHIQNFYKIECKINGWNPDPIEPGHYGYDLYAHILDSYFNNSDRINSKKLHGVWAENYLFWITYRPWEKTDLVHPYKGETEQKTKYSYQNDAPEHKKRSIIASFKEFKKLL